MCDDGSDYVLAINLIRERFMISGGYSIRVWLQWAKDGSCVVSATLSDNEDNVLASALGCGPTATDAETDAVCRLAVCAGC